MAKKSKSNPRKTPPSGKPSSLIDTRVIYCGDNLDQLKKFPDGCVDLIYIDPPFNSNRNYEVFWGETKEKRSFEDRHASTQAYIDFMRPRCVELHRVLKKTGSFYYHCDWHASHYVKIMLDQIFSENQFQNEVVWKRTPFAGSSKALAKQFPRSHDVLLFYTRGTKWTWNVQTKPYSEKYLERFKWNDNDGRGPYRKTLLKTYSQGTFERLKAENRLIPPIKEGAKWSYKQYLNESSGQIQTDDVWIDINAINPVAKERLGYPTQKPLALLDRIVNASSNPNDIVLDAFCGCGTALVAAENLGRQWIGIDISPTACRVMAKRLRDVCGMKEDENLWRIGRGFVVRDLPWSEKQLKEIPPFEFENWAVIALGGVPNVAKVGDMGIDGRIYPVSAVPKKTKGELEFMDVWYPIQVKQKDKVGRPDIDSFEAVMMREDRTKGFFVSFDFSSDAMKEIQSFFKKTGKSIIALTVKDILEEQIAYKLA